MAQSNMKSEKLSHAQDSHSFCGLGISSCFICHFGPSSESTGTGKSQPSRLVGSQDTPGGAGAGSGEQGPCLRDPSSPPLFFIKSCPSASAGLPLLRHRHCCELTFQKKPKMHPWFSNHFKRRALLNIHITPDPEQKAAAKNTYYYSPKYYFALLFFSHERFFSATQKNQETFSHCTAGCILS